jgi:proteasome lid subunit RPN8/RPN11
MASVPRRGRGGGWCGHPHVVVPVQHPDGQADQIAVPSDTSLNDLRSALSDAGYLHPFPTAQPAAAGALVNSGDFRNQSKAAWNAVNKGGNPWAESGFSVYGDGGASSLHTETHPAGAGMASACAWHDNISYGKDDFGIVHTHPNASSDKPSAGDVEAAKKIKKPIYVTSRTGLWMASPDGKVTQVFKSPTWLSDKKPN